MSAYVLRVCSNTWQYYWFIFSVPAEAGHKVYLHCDIHLCNDQDEEDCGCTTGNVRKRRALIEEAPHATLKVGPINFIGWLYHNFSARFISTIQILTSSFGSYSTSFHLLHACITKTCICDKKSVGWQLGCKVVFPFAEFIVLIRPRKVSD